MKFLTVLFTVFLMASAAFAGQNVVYKSGDGEYESYYAPVSASAPLVFMIQDWDGITDYEIKRAEMLNKLGYSVFAIDMFGKGIRPAAVEDRKRLTGELYADRAKMRRLLDAGYAKAKELGANVSNAVMMGYCFGGAVALEYARAGAPLKAFIPFHGGLATPAGQDFAKTKGEIVVFHGTADASVSMKEFAGLAEELEKAGIRHEMHTYSGAPHAFTVFGSPAYRADADRKSWLRFTEYLGEIFKK
ncbi:dienelactone hydrolase family protein [Seleniivibrio woodruffii]|uniref:Dienelactone hydrolase n=1 Tax=Seleniivibrio woodruffii TaxID=1078050 RepID=A0A4R1K6Q8_9BACT|nr:dienelactone hydrolase family protein [Seleniivibrio woodruffii]TCK59938.1 dienelactone hydrolase [Seleniivibrio woodruffii]TVZ35841.1 dienelactone hydrolase [Seleniivibrio woodruffii]